MRAPTARRRFQGFSLVIVLIVLALLSLMGVAVTQMTLLNERSSRYDRDWQIAWQAAEAALLDAEFDIRGPNTHGSSRVSSFAPTSVLGFAAGCGTGTDRGLCLPSDGAKPIWYTVDFTDVAATTARTVALGDFTGRTLDHGSTGVRPVRKPRYIIEVLPDTTPGLSASAQRFMYRVTAIGYGPREDSQAVLQMFFRKE